MEKNVYLALEGKTQPLTPTEQEQRERKNERC